jgi:hypothetical protein
MGEASNCDKHCILASEMSVETVPLKKKGGAKLTNRCSCRLKLSPGSKESSRCGGFALVIRRRN